jgi:hypothetical protein
MLRDSRGSAQQRGNHAILFAGTLLYARKVIETKSENTREKENVPSGGTRECTVAGEGEERSSPALAAGAKHALRVRTEH